MSSTDAHYKEREQSEIKHFALRLYLEAAVRILGSTRNLKYIDCCAGPWKSCSDDCSDTSFGIAVSVLKEARAELAARGRFPEFACLLMEKKLDAFRKLDAFAKHQDDPTSVRVHARNCDFTTRLAEIVLYCSSVGTFPFIFIDPTGWQLAGISRIKPLLELNPGEVLINLMSPFIGRFIKDNKTDFSDLLGEDFPALRALSGAALESAIVEKYCELIKIVGKFKYVCSLPVMNPDLDSFNFHLIYATRHERGVEVFKAVEKRTEQRTHIIRAEVQQQLREERSGNLELFGPAIQYRENSYQRLARSSKERAKHAVWALIESAGAIAYDECWGEALQFPAVYEEDLRDWISDWEKKEAVEVHGKPPRARVLHTGKGITLSRR